jgi:RimJ/RimL family protein N-acetyltransferase
MRQDVEVRPLAADDRVQWDRLYQAYAEFYKVEQTPEMRDRVWSWLHDPAHEVKCLVALKDSGELIGITHYRPFSRPLAAAMGCYLDDLFVTPQARGSGAVDALIGGVKAVSAKHGWSVVRWITAEDNYRARGVYDRVASRTQWVTYEIKL